MRGGGVVRPGRPAEITGLHGTTGRALRQLRFGTARRTPKLHVRRGGGRAGQVLVVEDAQVAGDDLVLEPRPVRDVDPVAVVGHDDDGALRGGHGSVGGHARDGQNRRT